MAERKSQFANGEIYHIVMRAIDGIDLFRDNKDYLRMIHDLFEFNDVNPAPSVFRVNFHRNKTNVTKSDLVTLNGERRKRDLLVEILAFCLMPNHVHLLLRQLRDNGISKFMQKFGGYALYFNGKYSRRGYLFQNRFREVHIDNDRQFSVVFVYIHTNPVALIYPGWKERGVTNVPRAVKFIENYRWSSYTDYLGKKNFPSVTSRECIQDIIGGPDDCRVFVNEWLEFKHDFADFDEIALG